MKPYSWNALDYEKNSAAQQAWAKELVAKLNLQGDERVLDIGCGDGKITAEIAGYLPDGAVVGIDNSEAMIELARTRYPDDTYTNLKFIVAGAHQLPFKAEFNLIFSNAALHWIEDHLSVLHSINQSLQPGGKILLQMGGQGNASELISVLEEMMRSSQWDSYFTDFSFPYFFWSPQEYQPWLKTAGLEPIRVELLPKDMTHQGRGALAGWICTTWLPYTQRLPESMREQFVTELVERYLQNHPVTEDGLTHVQMIRLEVEAQKPQE